jgi:hypothetical protein
MASRATFERLLLIAIWMEALAVCVWSYLQV